MHSYTKYSHSSTLRLHIFSLESCSIIQIWLLGTMDVVMGSHEDLFQRGWVGGQAERRQEAAFFPSSPTGS